MQATLQDELERLVLTAIRKGRWLAEGWRDAGLTVQDPLKRLLPQTLDRLTAGEQMAINDETALDLMGDAIRKALNEFSPKYGDVVMREEFSEQVFLRERIETLRKLAERWKAYQRARRNVRDSIAAVKQSSWLLRRECI
ncbi:hypothetical protein [uncultured Tateyamaria sp.]|uniref:hypothetical protein n=1 Tax=uncultured Tateyamaria sp. TaxID=455651 RepID=UPI00260F5394|nr:hypothetical protein [uncultured Tateyamaria sp.]